MTILSVVIKSYNEEHNIVRSIRSALEAINSCDAEVILADSLSTDSTVEIARQFPIRVIELADIADRSCGAAGQMGYQYAAGKYIYLLDGDMTLNAAFLKAAVNQLELDSALAGVGGLILEVGELPIEYRVRRNRARHHMKQGDVDRLNGGGLYRCKALKQVGYFTNRNLHSYEELELALRLQMLGWQLRRLPIVAVQHYPHADTAAALFRKRWRSRYADGAGELLRASLHKRYLLQVIQEVKIFALTVAWWLALMVGMPFWWGNFEITWLYAAVAGLPLAAAIIRKRSFVVGTYSFLSWQIGAAGLLRGFFKRQVEPTHPVASRELCVARPRKT